MFKLGIAQVQTDVILVGSFNLIISRAISKTTWYNIKEEEETLKILK